MLLKLASRNIWRNKRRTLINISAVAFAFFFVTASTSIEEGAWNHILNNVIKYYYGYAQIHQDGYWDEQILDNAFEIEKEIEDLIENTNHVNGLIPRLESFALAADDSTTTGVFLIGTDPLKEDQLTGLKQRLINGSYIESNDKALLVAKGICDKLQLSISDSLILISQGYHGANAVGLYPIKGILEFASPELNKRMVYLPIKEAQWFFGAEDLVTSIVIDTDQTNDVETLVSNVRSSISSDKYEVMDWKELLPELVEAKTLDSAGNVILAIVLYLIISFGIFGTILMMTKERSYEFGVLTAIGMAKEKLAAVVFLEILISSSIGIAIGVLFSAPLIYWFKIHPIDLSIMGENAVKTYEKFGIEAVLPATFEFGIFFNQALAIFGISVLLASYPVIKILRLKIIDAMR